jgi:hypothetical protein
VTTLRSHVFIAKRESYFEVGVRELKWVPRLFAEKHLTDRHLIAAESTKDETTAEAASTKHCVDQTLRRPNCLSTKCFSTQRRGALNIPPLAQNILKSGPKKNLQNFCKNTHLNNRCLESKSYGKPTAKI